MRKRLCCTMIVCLVNGGFLHATTYQPIPHVYHPKHVKPLAYHPVKAKSKPIPKPKPKPIKYHYTPLPHRYIPVDKPMHQLVYKPVYKPKRHAVRYHPPVKKTTPFIYSAGPYVGASLGVLMNNSGTPAVYRAAEGILSLGYGHLWHRFYLAAEMIGSESAELKNYINGLSNVQSGWSLGGDLIPGYLINDRILAYARVGGISTQFNAVDKNQGAWQVGVGGQTQLYQNLDLRADYIYSQYPTLKDIGTPCSNQFNVGLLYKFVG